MALGGAAPTHYGAAAAIVPAPCGPKRCARSLIGHLVALATAATLAYGGAPERVSRRARSHLSSDPPSGRWPISLISLLLFVR